MPRTPRFTQTLLTIVIALLVTIGFTQQQSTAPVLPNPHRPNFDASRNEDPVRRNQIQEFIRPNTSRTYKGVTLTWVVQDPANMGEFKIESENTSITGIEPPLQTNVGDTTGETFVLLDGVGLYLARPTAPGRSSQIAFHAWEQPSEFELTASPASATLYVSPYQPLRIGLWRVTVSGDAARQSAIPAEFQLVVENTESGEVKGVPLAKGSQIQLGRLNISVSQVSESTPTAQIEVRVEEDKDARGAEAYVTSTLSRGSTPNTMGELFERYAETYEFEVEWVENPQGMPASVEYAKSIPLPSNTPPLPSTVKERFERYAELLESDPLTALEVEWIDNTHLRVRPKNYDRVHRARASEEEELERFKRAFAENYTAVLRTYPLASISPMTAKALVGPELGRYLLLRKKVGGGLVSGATGSMGVSMDPGAVVEEGEHFAIIRLRSGILPEIQGLDVTYALGGALVDSTKEEAIADERANALLVKATPGMHETIAAMLERTDAMLRSSMSTGAMTRYPIEVVLLRGIGESEAAPVAQGTTMGLYLYPEIEAAVAEIMAAPGTKVKKGDPILRVDSMELDVALKQFEAGLKAAERKLEYLQKTHEITNRLAEEGRVAQSDVLKIEAEIAEAEAQLTGQSAQVEMFQSLREHTTLKAPWDGTITRLNVSINERIRPGVSVGEIRLDEAKASDSELPADSDSQADASLEPIDTQQLNRAERIRRQEEHLRRRVQESRPGAASRGLSDRGMSSLGLTDKDLRLFNLAAVEELGRAIVQLNGVKGTEGKATVRIRDGYNCELSYIDVREPYVIVQARLIETGNANQNQNQQKILLENTFYLEQGKPSVVGLTNLREALILVVRLAEMDITEPKQSSSVPRTDSDDRVISDSELDRFAAKILTSMPSAGSRERPATEIFSNYLKLFASPESAKASSIVEYFDSRGRIESLQKRDIDDGRTQFLSAKLEPANPEKREYRLFLSADMGRSSANWNSLLTLARDDGDIRIIKDRQFKRGVEP